MSEIDVTVSVDVYEAWDLFETKVKEELATGMLDDLFWKVSPREILTKCGITESDIKDFVQEEAEDYGFTGGGDE